MCLELFCSYDVYMQNNDIKLRAFSYVIN